MALTFPGYLRLDRIGVGTGFGIGTIIHTLFVFFLVSSPGIAGSMSLLYFTLASRDLVWKLGIYLHSLGVSFFSRGD